MQGGRCCGSPDEPEGRDQERPHASSRRRMGARVHVAVHGHVVGTRAQPAADLPRHRPRRLDDHHRRPRRHSRGDGCDQQGVLRHGLGLPRQAQAPRGARLRAGRRDEADLSTCCLRVVGVRCAVSRPHRQGHPRRTPRCARGGPDAPRSARRRLRAAAVPRHRGRRHRATARGRSDGASGERHPRGLLGGDGAGGAVGPAARRRRARTRAVREPGGSHADHPGGAGAATCALLADRAPRQRTHAGPLQRGVPRACARRPSGSAPRGFRWSSSR